MFQKKKIVDYKNGICNVPYLEFKGNAVTLKKNHMYYTQCQVAMYVTGLILCDLFIYTPFQNGSCCITIDRDNEFLNKVIPKCEKFYFDYVLPALVLKNQKK